MLLPVLVIIAFVSLPKTATRVALCYEQGGLLLPIAWSSKQINKIYEHLFRNNITYGSFQHHEMLS